MVIIEPQVKLNFDQRSIQFRRYGQGSPPVLLLHGWGGDASSLGALALPISSRREIIAPSLPGFGGSPEPPYPWGTEEYAATISRWLNRQNIHKADVIAHSFGGRIAIGLAASEPQLVGRIVLISSAGVRPRRSIKTRAKIAAAKTLKTTGKLFGGSLAEFLESRIKKLGSSDWKNASPVMRGTLSWVITEDLSAQMQRITAATLLIWGAGDRETPLWMGARMASLIPASRLVKIEDAGHYPFLDHRGVVLSEIWKHLGLEAAW